MVPLDSKFVWTIFMCLTLSPTGDLRPLRENSSLIQQELRGLGNFIILL